MFTSVGQVGRQLKLLGSGLAAAILTIAPLFVLAPVAYAAADTCTWTGATSNSFSTAANWTGCDNGTVPESGDTVVFPQAASNKNIDVDSTLPVRFMNITGSGYVFNRASFDEIILTGSSAGLTTTEDVTFHVPVSFGSSSTNVTSWASTGKTVTLTQPTTLGATGDVSFGSNIAGREGSFVFQQSVGGSAGQFVATNGTTMTLSASGSTYTAGTVGAESDGEFRCDDADCFGDAANHIYMGGGQVTLNVGSAGFMQPIETSASTPDASNLRVIEPAAMYGDTVIHDSLNVIIDDLKSVSFFGAMDIDSDALLQIIGEGPNTSGVSLAGAISGGGSMAFQGVTVTIGGNNTHTGEIIVSGLGSGTILMTDHINALGNTSGATIVEAGGQLLLGANSAEPVTITGDGGGSGALQKLNGTNPVLSGALTLDGSATVGNTHANETLTLSGRVTGTGDLTLLGSIDSDIIMSGATANDYVGKTTVQNTHLTLNKSANVVAIPGDIDVAAAFADTQVVVAANEQIANSAKVALTNGGSVTASLLLNSARTETVGTVEGDGYITFPGANAVLNVGGGNASGTFAGHLSGTSGQAINKIGSGTWRFNGVYDGSGFSNFGVTGGTLLTNPANTSLSLSSFTVSGGSLGGAGIIGQTAVTGGTVAPGNSPECLYPDGALSFNAASTLAIELDGTTQCSQYDKVAASGAVTLGSATLSLDPGFTPAVGTVFTIVEGSSVSGQFAGLANGATVTANGVNFRINYLPGSVTLTVLGGTLAAGSASGSSGLADTGAALWAMLVLAVVISGVAVGVRLYSRRRLSLG